MNALSSNSNKCGSIIKCFIAFIAIFSLFANFSEAYSADVTVTLQPAPGLNDDTDDGGANAGKDAGFTTIQLQNGVKNFPGSWGKER